MEDALFAGVRLTQALKDAMHDCPEIDRAFFTDPEYLVLFNSRGDSYLGRPVPSGTSVSSLEDLARNIISLIARISPTEKFKPSDIIIISDAVPLNHQN